MIVGPNFEKETFGIHGNAKHFEHIVRNISLRNFI